MHGLRLLTTTESKDDEDLLGNCVKSLPGTPRSLSRRFSDISLLEEGGVKEALCDSHLAPAAPQRRNMVRCHVERVERHKYYFGHEASGRFLMSAKLVGTSFYISQYQSFCNTFESESKMNQAPTQAGSGGTFCAVLRLDANTDNYTLYNRTCEGCDDVYGMHTCGVKSQANGDRQVLAQISHKNFVVNTFGHGSAEDPLVVNGVCVKIPVVYSDLSRDVWCQRTEEKRKIDTKRKAFEQRRGLSESGPSTPTSGATVPANVPRPTTPLRRPSTPLLGRSKPRVEERVRPRTGAPETKEQLRNSIPLAADGETPRRHTRQSASLHYIRNKGRSSAYRSNNNAGSDDDDNADDARAAPVTDVAGMRTTVGPPNRAAISNNANSGNKNTMDDEDEEAADVRPMAGSDEGMCEMSTMIPHYDVKTGSLRLRFLGDRVKIASSKNLMFSLDHSSNRILQYKLDLEKEEKQERQQRQQAALRREHETARLAQLKAEQRRQEQQRGVHVQPHVPQAAGLAHVAAINNNGSSNSGNSNNRKNSSSKNNIINNNRNHSHNNHSQNNKKNNNDNNNNNNNNNNSNNVDAPHRDTQQRAHTPKAQRRKHRGERGSRRDRQEAERREEDGGDSDSSGDWVEAHRRRHKGDKAELHRLREASVMQFGKYEDDLYSLDYAFPLSPLQAFAIALSLFQWKGPNKE